MPRPRVRPADRLRAARACVVCKASKKRCDNRLPCLLCVKKGQESLCHYPDVANRSGGSQSGTLDASESNPESLAHLETSVQAQGNGEPINRLTGTGNYGSYQLSHHLSGSPRVHPRTILQAETGNSTPARGQRPTMLRSSRGEQGPSSFTDRQRNESMLESEMPCSSDECFTDDLDVTEKQVLIGCFLRVSNGFLHLFSDLELSAILAAGSDTSSMEHEHNADQKIRDDLACQYLLVAIGAQCRGTNHAESQRARKYFAEAQKMAFVDLLQNPSLGMVKLFLLMAMYMLGACRRNTAFMYIGIASKAATILGLHVPTQNLRISLEEQSARRRTWMSLHVLDLLCSSILARPTSTPSIERDEFETDGMREESKDNHRAMALNANYECASIIDSIVRKFTSSSLVDVQSALNYLQMLQEWSQALPESLRKTPTAASENSLMEIDHQEASIGNIHVSCAYYFGVIIVTRQFLISRVMSQLRGSKRTQSNNNTSLPSVNAMEKERSTKLSNTCIGSAVYMVDLCYEAFSVGMFLGNMCILKAWIFSAGLVLGFSQLMEERDLSEVRNAFNHAQELLHTWATLSPQAEQYYNILKNFSSAIALYREQLSQEEVQSSNLYVEKIMTISTASQERESNTTFTGGIDQSQARPPDMLRTPDHSEGFGGFGDSVGMFSADFFAGELEMPSFTPQVDGTIGGLTDLEWLCYAAS